MNPRRNRVPTIFNIYMLDVICCSLGCVILLWQANYQRLLETEETAVGRSAEILALQTDLASRRSALEVLNLNLEKSKETAKSLASQLATSKDESGRLAADLEKIKLDRDAKQKLVLLRQKDFEKARDALLAAEALLKNVKTDYELLRTKNKLTVAELADKVKEKAELLVKLAETEDRLRNISKEAKDRKLDAETSANRLRDIQAKLILTEAQTKALEKLLDKLRVDSKDATAKSATNELKLRTLESDLVKAKKDLDEKTLLVLAQVKDIKEAKSLVVTLERERDTLVAKNTAAAKAEEQRFAGIALTGRKVVFLVDMSGSMELKDANTEDPDKWPEVCETIGKIMRSMPQLEHFQVILFSDKIRYLFEKHDRRWLIHEGADSIKLTVDKLKAIKPRGETNLHLAFQEAFLYKTAGLDTIYLFSDGLPNAGEALTPEAASRMSEQQRNDVLSKHLRARLKDEWNRAGGSEKRVRVNTVGFFFESPEVGAFLWALAREHDGSFVGMSKP